MKRLPFLFVIMGLALVSCRDNNTFTINGTTEYEGCDGYPVYIRYGDVRDTTVVSGNTFSFSGKIDSPEIADITIENDQMKMMYCYVVVEPGTIDVVVSPRSTSTGTELNDILSGYEFRKRERADVRRADIAALNADTELTDEQKAEKLEEIWDVYYADSDALYYEIFNAHNNDAIGADAMMMLADTREIFDSLYNAAGENVRNYSRVKKEVERYADLDRTAVGGKFIDFTVENGNRDGSPVSFSDYVGNGKYVIVDFWASWCMPCMEEMPNLKAVYAKYKGDNFDMVGVATSDKRQDTIKAVDDNEIPWNIIYDAQLDPAHLYGINAIPHIILFGPDGTILARELRGEEIDNTLAQYIKR